MEPCKKCHNRHSISVHFHALMRSEWHLRSGPLWPPGFYPQNSKTFCFFFGHCPNFFSPQFEQVYLDLSCNIHTHHPHFELSTSWEHLKMFEWHRSVSSITHCLRCQPPVRGRSPAKYLVPSFLLPTCIWHNWHLLKLVLQVCIAWAAQACQALHKLSAQRQIHSRRDGACHARENILLSSW